MLNAVLKNLLQRPMTILTTAFNAPFRRHSLPQTCNTKRNLGAFALSAHKCARLGWHGVRRDAAPQDPMHCKPELATARRAARVPTDIPTLQLVGFVERVNSNFDKKKTTTGVSLDVAETFDTMWVEVLQNTLAILNLRKPSSSFRSRMFQTSFHSATSTRRRRKPEWMRVDLCAVRVFVSPGT